MSEKKGWLSRIGGWFSSRKGNIGTEEAHSDLGLDLIKTRTFDDRVIGYNEFTAYVQDMALRQENGKSIEGSENWLPEDRVKFLYKSTCGLMGKLNTVSIPWGAGGEAGYYTAATFGWAAAYSITLTMIQAVQYLLDLDKIGMKLVNNKWVPDEDAPEKIATHNTWKPKIDKIALIESLEYYYFKYFTQYALKVSYISWFTRDIAPTKVAMIQNIPQQSGGIQQVRSRFPGVNENE